MGDAREAIVYRPRSPWPENTVVASVLAFDPGGTTGWCAMQVPAKILLGEGLQEWEDYIQWTHGQIDCETMTFADAEANVKKHNGLTIGAENRGVGKMLNLAVEIFPDSPIVLEDFILDFRKADMKRETLSPVRLISMFSFGMCIKEGAPNNRIFIQGRSNVKTTCTDERLRNWGLYDRSSGAHARDATRHAFYFLRSCRGGSFDATQKRHDAWPDLFQDPYELFPAKKPSSTKEKVKKLGERIHL